MEYPIKKVPEQGEVFILRGRFFFEDGNHDHAAATGRPYISNYSDNKEIYCSPLSGSPRQVKSFYDFPIVADFLKKQSWAKQSELVVLRSESYKVVGKIPDQELNLYLYNLNVTSNMSVLFSTLGLNCTLLPLPNGHYFTIKDQVKMDYNKCLVKNNNLMS